MRITEDRKGRLLETIWELTDRFNAEDDEALGQMFMAITQFAEEAALDEREIAAKPMDEAALIEEVARVIRDTSFCGFSEPDGSRSYCSRESADPKSCECFVGARALLPIIRRIHNEAVEACAEHAEDRDDYSLATAIRQLKEPEQ